MNVAADKIQTGIGELLGEVRLKGRLGVGGYSREQRGA